MTLETVTPELAAQIREIAYQVFREQYPAPLGDLERELRPRRIWPVERPDWVGTTLRELAEAQKRTEQRVGELAQAQKRTEARFEELIEIQKDLEEKVGQVILVQWRMEERQDAIEHQLGRIADVLGVVEAEVEAEETLVYVLEQKGYRLFRSPQALDLDGEIDVVVPAETPEGEQVWVLAEAKARARLKGLRRWAQRLASPGFVQRLEGQGVTRPYLFYLFGLRVYQLVEDEARKLGLGVLDPNGERVAPTLIR